MFNLIKNLKKAGSMSIKDYTQKEEFLIYPETKVEYPAPKTIETEINQSFVAAKEQIPAFYVRKIKNGKCFTGNGLVLSPDNIPFNEYTVEENHPLRNKKRFKFNKPLKIKGTVALLSTDPNNINFYHWMVESFPKFHLVEKSGFTADKYIICNKMPYQQQLLEKVGIKDEQVIWFDENTLIQADELILPDIINNFRAVELRGKLCYNAKYIPPWIFEFYRGLILSDIKETAKRKIFISREKAKYRNITNEPELFSLLKKQGFEKIHLEDLSIFEQAEVFYNAEFIISPHGAGLTNLMFCRPETKVIEIFSPTYLCNNQQLIARSLGLDYAYVICNSDSAEDTDLLRENIVIDLDKVRQSLKLLNSSLYTD